MVGGTIWPVLGIQPLNHLEHATQIIAEATALLELDSTNRAKVPATSLEALLNSVINLAKKAREQLSGQEILGKLNSVQPINAVNNAFASPAPVATNTATRIASWADVVRSGTPSYPSTPNSRASTTASVRDRETVVKLDANAAAVCRQVSSEDLCKRMNDALSSRINLLGKAPQAIAAKRLKSGDIVLHTATTAIEKIESEDAVLHEGAKVTYVGWLTREGRKKQASSPVVEFTTKYHANPFIQEGQVLNAIHHDCVLAMPKRDADTARERTIPRNA
ncbi:hypothetical protein BO83DRAFT_404152 [Aspergillus eucalypticola CBS 122712]|uniref:Uncharacterized protein n=1 Tax=Aspergillus eucalypticola (strain CBS 122712 / IBT 29274) TaxID=1448314 RepID=A0A317UPN8_ASPEC|nr:uncharacterized protein BO83DRAFT_404152 [Aspergillus eucalypticola CBS 122712]PWY61990.1 hypothetical protein BO83DRAFT_404152 [Aspergillus eucalypticola CBS 122712]